MKALHPELPPIAFLAALSLALPLPWHWRAKNTATLSMIFWLFVLNIIYGVNALVWGHSVQKVVPIWCDISTKLIVGANFALPAACLCICIHLERVASVRAARTSGTEKRRRQIFELILCFGLPLLFMALHYVVQGHRFDIIEGYGCRPTTYFSIPALFIVWIPPLLLSFAALIFAGLALRHFLMRRLAFSLHLDTNRSALTTSRYIRLMLMSALQMVWSISITSYALWFTLMALPMRPWTNWADVHSDFSRIDVYPAVFTPARITTNFYVLWWTIPASTFLFVAFFAFGRDAIEEYKKCFLWCRHLLRQSPSNEKQKHVLPITQKFDHKALSPSLPSSSTTSPSPPPYTLAPFSFHPDLSSLSISCASSASSPYSGDPRAIGSLSDLATPTSFAATAEMPVPEPPFPICIMSVNPATSYEPPSPLTPPPVHPQARGRTRVNPASPRPFTYPTHDASWRNPA